MAILPSFPKLTKNEKIFIFSAFMITILFWGGFVGYYLIKLNRIVNYKRTPIDTSAYRLPTSSPTLSPTQQPKQKPTLAKFTDSISNTPSQTNKMQEFHSEKHNLSFKYPGWMQLADENQEKNNWSLSKLDIPLVDITITNLTIQDARQQNPELNFIKYQDERLSGWKADVIGKDNSFFRKLYIFERKNEKIKDNIWILVYLSNVANQSTEPEKIVAEIIQSVSE